MPPRRRSLASLLACLIAVAPQNAGAEPCCDPAGPFRAGEEWPETLATCETIAHWAERAPDTNDRVTLGIKGRLAKVTSNGALAYLLMCDVPGMQVLCVTYETNGMQAGDEVAFGGGYQRVGAKRIMLDPCLASRED